jgi:solute carrier family 25 carnitine/acylcarnitine transporter 20/29
MSNDESESKKVDPFKNFVAGGVGGACLVIIGHPPDTIKVQLQTMPRPKNGEKPMYTGALDCVKKTIKKEVCSLDDFTRFFIDF